jgi:D-alanine-D-alanine ligase
MIAKPPPDLLRGKLVAVLMGGPGVERDVSLRSGASTASALRSLGADVREVELFDSNFELPDGTFLAFNMIHGTFGEDGEVQAELERRGVPYTGDGIEASRLAFDKILSKEKFTQAGVPSPNWEVIKNGESPKLTIPFVVKAPKQGSSLGMAIVHSTGDIPKALETCYAYDNNLLVEQFISGRELTVGILGQMALPVIEIVPKGGVYDYQHKYTKGGTEYHVPAPLTPAQTRAVTEAALSAYRALGLQIYGRADVILTPSGNLGVLEVNTIPGMTETSLLPKAANAVGISFPELCLRIAHLSLQRFL